MNELNIKNGLIVDGGLTATTISATTYINLPTSVDIYVTGGTYSNGTATFTNNTGGTFNVNGFNASNPSAIPHTTASGTDTYIATVSGVTGYTDGDAYLVRFTNGNTTDCTLNINSIGAINLYRNNDGKLLGGDIQNNGEMICIYNSSLNVFQCVGISPNTLFAYVTNDDSVTITKGQPVYAFSGTGDRMTVKRAKNTSDLTSAQTVGLVYSSSILPNQKGLIIIQGLLDGLNILPTSTWADGNPVYLGDTDGSITNIKPYAPNHLVYLGFVTTASNGSAGRMYVRIQNGYELDEIHNVVATGATYGDLIVYSASGANNLWVTSKTLTGTYKVNGNLNITGTTSSNSISATTISGGTFYGDGSGLTNLPSAPSGKFGIPNSAGTYTFYSNLAAAMSAATSGQTIEMFTDVTESGTTAITLKSGVSINGHGHIYTFTPTTSNVFNFIDGGVAVNFNFFNITLRKSGTQTGGGVLGLSVSNSIINGLSTKIIVDTPSSYGISNYGGTVFAGYVNGFEIISNVATSMSVSLIRGTIVNCRMISNSTTGTALINLGSINNSFVQCTSSGYGVHLPNSSTIANNIISYSNTGAAVAGGGLLNNSTVYSSGGYGVSGTNVRNCTIISDGNIAAYLSNIYNSSVYSTSNVGAFIQNQTITTSTIISTANSGVQLFDASNISTSYISTTSANPALLFSNNSLTSKAKNCTIVNTANSASGHGVRFNFTNAYLLDCQIQVANTSANCMYAASAFAVRYAGCEFEGATTSINANITQAITNTPDSQGNIIIN